jgi:hypothetical protein
MGLPVLVLRAIGVPIVQLVEIIIFLKNKPPWDGNCLFLDIL